MRCAYQDDPADEVDQILIRAPGRVCSYHCLFDDQSTKRMADEYKRSIGLVTFLCVLPESAQTIVVLYAEPTLSFMW
jgi:hypothetical protein